MKAAIFHGAHQPLTIEQVDIDTPIDHEVVVRVVASGVCHSDLHFVDGFYPFPRRPSWATRRRDRRGGRAAGRPSSSPATTSSAACRCSAGGASTA